MCGGETEQFGTDSQPGLSGGAVIDLKTNLIVFDYEIDHATGFDELIGLAYGQNAGVVKPGDNFGQIFLQFGADEQDLAICGLNCRGELLQFKGAASDRFIPNGFFQVVSKDILTQHTNDNRRIGISENFGRPIHEFGEIEQESRLDLVFRSRLLGEASEMEN